ncbi:MAG: MFS transporter [Candidatus Scatovivens sp.]
MEQKKKYEKNLKLTAIETILTSIGAGFSVSTITLFWNSIGMNQTDIGFTQMMFTIVLVCLDIPMGYLADRFNRKIVNIIGDVGVALTFLFYAFSQNMFMAIIAECLLGVFMAMTNGVDFSFIKYNSDKIDPSGELFKKVNSKLHTWRYIATFTVMLIGGYLSKYSLRLTIAMSFIPYFAGGIIAIFIKDFAKKTEKQHDNILKDMLINAKKILKNAKTRTYVLSYVIAKEITHPHIWIFTPLLVMVGVPIEVVSIGWVISEVVKIFGAKLSEKLVKYKISNRFVLSVGITFLWMLVLIIDTNIFTVWMFALNGFVVGLNSSMISIPLQESVKEEYQTSVLSIASTGARLFYIPLVYIINYLGNIKIQLALVGMIIIFIPLSTLVFMKLRKCEEVET